VFGSIGWIAMVLVHESFRQRGIGTRLVQRALEYLERRSVATIRLDATPLARPTYERMGFVAQHELVRVEGLASPDVSISETAIVPARAEHMESLIGLDQRATGTDRRRLIEKLLAEHSDGVRLAVRGESVLGYAMLRPGTRAAQIGPAVAMNEQVGRSLCDWAFRQCAGRPLLMDIPRRNRLAIEWARSRRLAERREFARMVRGKTVAEQPALLWGSSGPEKG
jgi:hypothetical protein